MIEVKKDRNIENLLNGLYKKTAMEDTYGVNMLAVKDKQPITFTLKHMLQEFVLFQEELYTKEYEHLLAKAKDRLEIGNGLIKATDVIDLIIEILRGSQSVKQAKSCLIDGITEGITFRSKKSEKDAATLSLGIAGIMLAARVQSALPTGGEGYEMNASAAAVIGLFRMGG